MVTGTTDQIGEIPSDHIVLHEGVTYTSRAWREKLNRDDARQTFARIEGKIDRLLALMSTERADVRF